MTDPWLSTTSRAVLTAPTGLGKTNFAMALAFAIADGAAFLPWRGSGRAARVLYIDGEMSKRLLKARLADAARFRAEFTRKGPMTERMREVPSAVIRREHVALYGLAMLPIED